MIYNKLLKIQEKWIALKKDKANPFFKSNYVSLDNILDIYTPLLTEVWIICYHFTKDGKLTTVLLDTEDESKIETQFNILNTDPQKQGSEISYWKRYGLWQLLNIQTDIDDDWNKASKQTVVKQVEEDNKPRFWDENLKKLVELKKEWKTFTMSDIRKKYRIAKRYNDDLEEFVIKKK